MNLFQTNLVHFRLQQVLNIVSDISYNTYFSLITVTCRVWLYIWEHSNKVQWIVSYKWWWWWWW